MTSCGLVEVYQRFGRMHAQIAACLLGLFFDSEDGGSMFLQHSETSTSASLNGVTSKKTVLLSNRPENLKSHTDWGCSRTGRSGEYLDRRGRSWGELQNGVLHNLYFLQYIIRIWYIEVSQHNNFLMIIIKQNRHYCVNIRFYLCSWQSLHVSTPLLGHHQAYVIQACYWINMNLYCAHILRMLLCL
jgi:hypothetical protein